MRCYYIAWYLATSTGKENMQNKSWTKLRIKTNSPVGHSDNSTVPPMRKKNNFSCESDLRNTYSSPGFCKLHLGSLSLQYSYFSSSIMYSWGVAIAVENYGNIRPIPLWEIMVCVYCVCLQSSAVSQYPHTDCTGDAGHRGVHGGWQRQPQPWAGEGREKVFCLSPVCWGLVWIK